MAVRQLSVFLDNTAGRLCKVTRILGDNGVNIRGFSLADTADFGILRLIVDQPGKAAQALRSAHFTVHDGPVILARVLDHPGGFATALEGFASRGINVEYAYGTVCSSIVFGVNDLQVGEQILREEGMVLMTDQELPRL
jgi:hypothetical protein